MKNTTQKKKRKRPKASAYSTYWTDLEDLLGPFTKPCGEEIVPGDGCYRVPKRRAQS